LSENGEVKLWDVENNAGYFVCETGRSFRTAAVELRRGLIAVAQTGSLELYSIESCKRVAQLTRIKTRISALKFHPNGLSVLAAGVDGRLYRWRFGLDKAAKSFQRQQLSLERYFGHATSLSSLAIHPTGRVFFSGDLNGVIHAWLAYDADKFQGEYDRSFFGFQGHSERALRSVGQLAIPDRVESLYVSQDGEYLLAASQDGTVELWKVRGFVRIASVKAHAGLIYDLSVIRQHEGILAFFTIGRDGFVRLWNVEENQLLKTYSIEQKREFKLLSARMLAGVSESTLLIGTRQGKLLDVQLRTTKGLEE
jgi:WD40 repeat protein